MTTGTFLQPTRRSLVLSVTAIIIIAALVTVGLLALYVAGTAHADPGVGAGSGSAVVDAVSGAGPIVPPPASVVSELNELKTKYEAIKSQGDKDAKLLLWAGLIATVLKLLLTLIHRVSGPKPQRWMAWIAMGLSVPIALFSHYALGNSVFDSLLVALGGPGAVMIHELMQAFKKPDPVTTTPA